MAHLISGQGFRDEATVNEKLANRDFDVFVSPVFEIDGEEYQVVTDGHHSYDAAIMAGVEPTLIVQTAMNNDKIGLLEAGKIEDYLLAEMVDLNSYVFVSTDREVW